MDDPSVIKSQVASILSSGVFRRSRRLCEFLAFIVDETLSGRADKLTEHSIATQVYRRRDNFDPAIDNIVRAEARRLRRKLDEYYQVNPPSTVRILVPKGTYVPEFVAPLPRRWRLWKPATLGSKDASRALVALLALGGLLLAFAHGVFSNSDVRTPAGSERTLALASLDNQASGAGAEMLSYAVPRGFAKRLLNTDGLAISEIAAESDGRQASGSEATPPSSMSTSSASDYLLDGRVEPGQESKEYRVTLQLTRGDNRRVLWTDYFVGDVQDVLGQVEGASLSLRVILAAEIGGAVAGNGHLPTGKLEASKVFLKPRPDGSPGEGSRRFDRNPPRA